MDLYVLPQIMASTSRKRQGTILPQQSNRVQGLLARIGMHVGYERNSYGTLRDPRGHERDRRDRAYGNTDRRVRSHEYALSHPAIYPVPMVPLVPYVPAEFLLSHLTKAKELACQLLCYVLTFGIIVSLGGSW